MSQPLCIMVHGFTGSPWEVDPLVQALSESGYEVVAPLLPGHYHTRQRMTRVRASDWIESIEMLTKSAMSEERTVHLVGFSMGAMLAAIVGYRHAVRTLVLLSPSVYVATPHVIVKRSRHAFKLMREDRSLFNDLFRNNVRSVRSSPFYNVLQFQKVVRYAKKVIPHLHIPVCIIHGLEDEIVDPRSSRWIYRTISSEHKELCLLPGSRHLVCHDIEVNLLIQTVTNFLAKYP